MAFKENTELKNQQIEQISPYLASKIRFFMQKNIFLPCAHLILSDNIITIADNLNSDLLDQVIQVVEMTC
jgi:hypothetical protein